MLAAEQQSHCVRVFFECILDVLHRLCCFPLTLLLTITNMRMARCRYPSFLFEYPNSRLSETLHECLPNINTLILTGNNLQELCDLDALTLLPKLETLSLLMNPVATKPNYREYVAFK